MNKLACIIEEIHQFYTSSFRWLACFGRSTWLFYVFIYQFIVLRLNSFIIRSCHFVFVSTLGFLALKAFKPRAANYFTLRNLDLFFTSVSAVTTSSMSTIEMEVFSDSQLIVITLLMFMGGEVFVSMMGIHFKTSNLNRGSIVKETERRVGSFASDSNSCPADQFELSSINNPQLSSGNEVQIHIEETMSLNDYDNNLNYNSIQFLGLVVFFYLFGIHLLGVTFLSLYLTTVSSAKNVLKTKGLNTYTFSIFTVVSTFSNCGFIPTNENMMVFRKNSGLLLMLIPLALLGNTLFPPFLRLTLRLFGKSPKGKQSKHLLNNAEESGYRHLLSSTHSCFLALTVLGLIAVQFVMFSAMEWNSQALIGLNAYEKLTGALFQCVNSRHTGETMVNLSIVSPVVLVMFVAAMYLPPYTSFLPINFDSQSILQQSRKTKRRTSIVENIVFSQLSYLAMFIILVCITERNKMKEDPLNFNVFNIVIEVISAYGNVGFSTGYSCELQLVKDASCKDKWFGFSGMWSDEGKIVLIIVMFFGRLKSFNMDGGKAWKLM